MHACAWGHNTHFTKPKPKTGEGASDDPTPPPQIKLTYFNPKTLKLGGWAMNPLTRLKPKTLCNWGMGDDPIDTIKLNNSEIERVMALLL